MNIYVIDLSKTESIFKMIQINKSILIEWINMYNSKEAIMPIICGESQQHLEFDDTLILRVEDLDKK